MQGQSARPASREISAWEIYSNLRTRAPLVVRADGRGFRKILEGRNKPYDLDFARSMADAAARLFQDSGLIPALAFTFSDEISMLFLDAPFGGRVEKIDSLTAGFLSAALSLDMERLVSMDCRVVSLCEAEIADYLAARQDEAWRNHVFSYGFYMLAGEGLSVEEAMEKLRGMREQEIHELVFQRGVNLARTPAWERRGVLIHRKKGNVLQDWELPLFKDEDGQRLLAEIIGEFQVKSRTKNDNR
ncbi:MAG TPA: tRNA(His) guanylyltransferase Thg1 family protein [Methanothrix sp.]|nr:tRNA(His) guanylyltransferase Thg1 family protein [Methanothrix sp.]